ncbi:ABC transporter ATP-binding protein [Dermatophilus congolensis]|uniref:Iron(3+)-hydroxamate import ATP-binding protein FhuC n=1 Tax=Dermatophilus congolensis TaxID=1863 RepID=A0A239V703_9MICO|nr:ABC transporter ATP-binding protein [Dermatophilus congolensis]MBO3130347.1 ABC transporter ATP-binding protein [Dermatophilus congolensis]MBO3131022.1 ABC transporter ATP-binding protein [Dermatophilus congolensis]MBO3134818.1 ABC transporter ATP-binding protein [Dermatophilus congolensis]MBO3137055.1 ABC transporter ATP-binding protein [Dermatophilus congolensis]MBO3139299.1 ABC transporter ATP-binding protein [Dermatophilus congolensis]
MNTPSLTATDLAVAIDGRTILSNANIHLQAGHSLALVGPNGSGKSTLIRALAGIRTPAAGHVHVNDTDLHTMRPRERARLVSVVAQDENPLADQYAGEYVALGLTPHLNPWSRPGHSEHERVLEALKAVGMADFADRPMGHMSGGERRRVILARGLVQDTPLLFLDEPTNHLDIAQQIALLDLVRELDKTVVAAIHDLDLALAYFDNVAVIHEGRIQDAGESHTVITGQATARAFGVHTATAPHPRSGQEHLLLESMSHPRPNSHLMGENQ